MELITRTIIRDRGGREVPYLFQTYDVIFADHKGWLGEFLKHARQAFMFGMPSSTRSPSQERAMVMKTVKLADTNLCEMAQEAGYHGKKWRQHTTVQDYFLENDPLTIATELPVWGDDWSGCIDVVRFDPKTGIFWLLDFKPDAAKEKHVTAQLWHYARLLHLRTGIPYSKMRLAYFDGQDAFEVLI